MKKGLLVISLLFLAVMCWRLLSAPNAKQPPVSRTGFLQALDSGRIQRVTIYMGYTLADIKFVGKDSSSADVTDIPTKDLPNLIKKMIDDGVSVEFAAARKSDWAEFAMNLVSILINFILVGYIYFIRLRKKA
jgi:hypothetical protein